MKQDERPGLLVSVRSATEAEAALEGGAHLIDVKEPLRGPLGRADDETLTAVVQAVAGRRPVSAALGELLADAAPCLVRGLAYVKWGLAGWAGRPGWRRAILDQLVPGRPQVVAVAYADCRLAEAPPVEEVCAFACERPGNVLLLDTYHKGLDPVHGRQLTLLDWLSVPWIARLCVGCRAAGVRVALAGSLGPAQVRALLPALPDWIAVRGAACAGGRDGTVSAARVRELVELVTAPVAAATSEG